MDISGLQKLTLLDYPGKVACTVFTQGCNFRCPFCHNAALVVGDSGGLIKEEELLSFLKKRRGVLEGVAVTGGEPTLNAGLPMLLEKIKELGYFIKLDSNGTNPDMLRRLISAKLVDRVAMDIKNSPGLYDKTAGCRVFLPAVEESKELLLSGVTEYEFRTTVVKGLHTKESLVEAAKWIAGAEEYYLQQFVDSGNLIDGGGFSAFSENEMKDFAEAVKGFVPSVKLRGI